MGSVAASQYAGAVDALSAGLPPAAQEAARSSIAGAMGVASQLPGDAGIALRNGAEVAFVDGVHFAVTVGAILSIVAAGIVLRFLPRRLAHEGASRRAFDAVEDTAELGLAGVPPLFADTDTEVHTLVGEHRDGPEAEAEGPPGGPQVAPAVAP